MPEKIPVLVVGDAPNVTGGLSRIARDITALLYQDSDVLGIEVMQAGILYDGSPWPWRVFPLHDEPNWGRGDFERVWSWAAKGRQGVVFSVWDPARCFELKKAKWFRTLPGANLWGYFAIDSVNEQGGFGGPAKEVVEEYDRVLGYCAWGAKVLRKVMGEGKKINWLPHGLDLARWQGISGEASARILGCVAANQPRKDFPLLFAAARELKKQKGWEGLKLWLHTDFAVKHWSVPELADIYGWNNEEFELTSGLGDAELAAMYSACTVTFGIGSGEGFGYPLVESLAAGTPCVHGNFGGGAEFIPRQEWLVQPSYYRIDGTYALQRPVYNVGRVVAALKSAGEEKLVDTLTTSEYCKGAVKNLDWKVLWPRWRNWFAAGLKELKETM